MNTTMSRFQLLECTLSAVRRIALASACLVGLFLLTNPSEAGSRFALVIGNSDYRNVPILPNPKNDAKDVADVFTRLGFSVALLQDATLEEFRIALRDFSHATNNAEISVVYFAGHGIEVGGTNWLIPIDASLRSDDDIDKEALSLDVILRSVEESHFSLLILDACRNNPFASKMERTSRVRAVERGLVRVRPATNVLVAFAARDGTTADDGAGRNSPFTSALLSNLETPGLEVDLLFRRVRDQVLSETHGHQQPFIYGVLSKQLTYLNSASITGNSPSVKGLPHSGTLKSVAACDRLGVLKFDKGRPTSIAGVDADKIDVIAALAACEAAIREHPRVSRFYLQQGRAALALKNYHRAHDLFEKASDLGNSMAMYDLGLIYLQGLGFAKDEGRARLWFQKSVDLGNTRAMTALGLLYSASSESFPADEAQALRLFEQAAADEDPIAMNSLGVFYETGRHVPQDYDAARTWYERAAALGNEVAMRNLGSLYERGVGVRKDIDIAKHWYEQAAAAGDLLSKNRLQALK